MSLMSPALAGGYSTFSASWEVHRKYEVEGLTPKDQKVENKNKIILRKGRKQDKRKIII